MNKSSDSLFRLIHSLDTSEKGYVIKFLKRHSEKGNVNLDLFSAIEKQKEYNETALKKKFKNLAVVKVQTWEDIMAALRIYHKNKSFGFKRHSAIEEITILRDKGLRKDAEKIAAKEIKKCYEIDDFHGLIAFLNLREVRSNKRPITQDVVAEAVDNGLSEIISTIGAYKEFYEYYRESARLYYLQLNPQRKNYIAEINSFKSKSFLFQKDKPSNNYTQRFYHEAHALYYAAVGNKKLHIEHL